MLSVSGLTVSYGNITALRGISFSVVEGEIVTLIGANGAGKSSTLRALSGLVSFGGDAAFDGRPLRGRQPHEIVAMGMSHVPEGRGIFGNLTVKENLALSTWQRKDKGAVARDLERMMSTFPRVAERMGQLAGTLSGGEQQMLAVARALMSGSRLLLLDEPSMGLSPLMTQTIYALLREINREGKTIFLVEQNANMALHVAGRGYVLETGEITLAGRADELRGARELREAYLGG